MVQITGSYKLVENKNFYEFLKAVDFPEDKAKEASEIKGTLRVSLDGKKFKMENDTPAYVTNLVIDEEADEIISGGITLKSTTKLDGNVVTISMKTKDGNSAGSRILTFSDSGLEVVISVSKDGQNISGTRIYKRV